MPSPLVAFHGSALATHVADAAGAKSALAAAQSALAAASSAQAAATAQIAAKLDQRKAVQRELSQVTIPGDATPLLAQLEAIVIGLRAQQAALNDANTASVAATAEIARAEAALRRATAGIGAETAAQAAASARADDEQAWLDALASPDFIAAVSQAKSDFTHLPEKETPGYAAAKGHIETSIPAALLTLARDRATAALADAASARGDVTTALTSLDQKRDQDGGLAAQVEKLSAAFEAKRAALRDAATQTLPRITRALGLLAAVAARPALTQSESDAIAALTADAAAAQQAYDDAVAASEPQATLDQLLADLKAVHDKWEAAVPDSLWSDLDDFEEAGRILTAVAGLDLAAITAAFSAAESALATKLDAQLQNTLARAALSESLLALVPVADRAAAPELVFSALRGDG